MPLTEVLLQELADADDALIRGAIEWVRHQKRQPAEALEAVQAIDNEFSRVAILGELAAVNSYYFSAALDAARTLKNEQARLLLFEKLALIDPTIGLESMSEADQPVLTVAQQQELDRRLDRYEQNPTAGISWDDLKSKLLNSSS